MSTVSLAPGPPGTYDSNVNAKGFLGSCWTPRPIATLDVRRSPETICTVRLVDDQDRIRTRTGRRARRVDGGSIDFFRTGVLAAMLGRRAQCIYHWEQEHGFPRPWWNVVSADGVPFTNRLYSRHQLFAVQRIHRHFGFLRGRYREAVADFATVVSLVFELVDRVPIGEATQFIAAALAICPPDVGSLGGTLPTPAEPDRTDRAPGGWRRLCTAYAEAAQKV